MRAAPLRPKGRFDGPGPLDRKSLVVLVKLALNRVKSLVKSMSTRWRHMASPPVVKASSLNVGTPI